MGCEYEVFSVSLWKMGWVIYVRKWAVCGIKLEAESKE